MLCGFLEFFFVFYQPGLYENRLPFEIKKVFKDLSLDKPEPLSLSYHYFGPLSSKAFVLDLTINFSPFKI